MTRAEYIIDDDFLDDETKMSAESQGYLWKLIRCKDCKFHHDRTQCSKRIGAWFDDDYCNGAVRAERKEE